MVPQQFLDELFQYLRFPSISTDPGHTGNLLECADWLVARFQSLQFDAMRYPTDGHPVVVARSESKLDRPTVLIYGHYDVQPVDPLALWTSPPFDPEIRDDIIFARGSTDNKGQNFAHLLGVEQALREDGDLPVNVVFLLEGEEEIGSPNLGPFLETQRDLLQCNVVAVSDTGMVGRGIPTMTYGLRGIACLEFTLRGPRADLHSGIYGGAGANPAMVAAHLTAGLQDAATGRVDVDGFYDQVRPMQDWEAETWSRLPDGDREILDQTGVPAVWGEEGYDSYARRWVRPTAEVNGIGAGYQGEGSKTVIGKEATVKLSCRLVPDQDPLEILERVTAHLRAHCPPAVELEVRSGHHGKPYLMDPHAGFGRAAQCALRETFDAEPVLIREGGSIPIVQDFRDRLGVDTLLLGLALPDCQAHAPDERCPVEDFAAGIRLSRALLREIGRQGTEK